MKTQEKKLTRPKKPLTVNLINASGKEIKGIIMAGKFPDEDPTLKLARELGGKYKHLVPSVVSK
ncbi:hypothetical protein [Fibrivirga algicola]|uniref:Uncharacterized protein n=1 Tax=Fibrivirga algicola TaxID=2950420 RepID=A0ABX0QIP5_9BACT|nr:hypothetical protein [Fibrivirga algicola]ARK12242.1 hypothetical protein A6C57_18930 [Fibrella sp. ES10-3-2-2]NID10927.1 hypothetical protein [Fibrivirga algicola]